LVSKLLPFGQIYQNWRRIFGQNYKWLPLFWRWRTSGITTFWRGGDDRQRHTNVRPLEMFWFFLKRWGAREGRGHRRHRKTTGRWPLPLRTSTCAAAVRTPGQPHTLRRTWGKTRPRRTLRPCGNCRVKGEHYY